MADAIEKPQLVIPIEATHILGALDIARVDEESFRQHEMQWLEENNTLFKLFIENGFRRNIKRWGLSEAEALMRGRVLANHAVRLCVTDDPDAYNRASQNYRHNYDADTLRLRQAGVDKTIALWSTKETLDQIFGDEELSEAFMQIRHITARDSAAITVGFFSLVEIPEVVYT